MAILNDYNYENFEKLKPFLLKNEFLMFEEELLFSCVNGPHAKTTKAYIDSENYLIKEKIHGTEYVAFNDKNQIIYKINSNGFRTKHFEKLKSKNTNILFLGCSFTSGVGLPEELIWTNQLIKMLDGKLPNINYYNLGLMGAGIDIIINNLRVFIDNYGKPDYIFILYPGVERMILFFEDAQKFIQITSPAKFLTNKKESNLPEFVADFAKNTTIENLILSSIQKLHMVELMCKNNGIKLFWGTWHEAYLEMYKHLNFNNYVPIPPRRFLDKNNENLPYWKEARDLSHPGSGYNQSIAKHFFNAIF